MAWFSRFTRYGDLHIVYGQEKEQSCSMASIMMAFFKTYKLVPGKQAVHEEEKVIKEYVRQKGSAHDFNRTGAVDSIVLNTINALDSNRWTYEYHPGGGGIGGVIAGTVGVSGAFGPVVNANVAMVGITWLGGGGGHWVVVDTVRKVFGDLTATVCDPWDTNVHMQGFTRDGTFIYRPGDGGFMVSIGTHKGQASPYGKRAAGIADAIIYRR